MESESIFSFNRPFEDEKRDVVVDVLTCGLATDLQRFQSIVAILSSERLVTAENQTFRNLVLAGRSGIGWKTDQLQPPPFRTVEQKIDSLLLDGVTSIELEHIGALADGRPCTFLTYKRRLDELRNPEYSILVVSRPIAIVGSSELERRKSLSELLTLLQQLDSVDQTICRAYSRGDSTRDIAAAVGLTTRAVEFRRQKILTQFGFERPIEIVKMLVRLEEHGLI